MDKQDIQQTYTVAILFGMWLQLKEQRKRLAKTDMLILFNDWINMINKDLQKDE
jgi:hypothetical protein